MPYHLNPESGKPGVCRAKIKCRFGVPLEEHYASKEEAQEAYERRQVGALLTKTRKETAPGGRGEEVPEEEPRTYTLLASRVGEVQRRVERANKRLEGYGIPERFALQVEEFTAYERGENGLTYAVEKARVTLSRPRISYGGYTFLARIEEVAPGAFTAYSAPGVELQGWRPRTMNCEHCGKVRHRTKVYAVQGEDGTIKVVGASCVEAYTGLAPGGLQALEWEDEVGTYEEEDRAYDLPRVGSPTYDAARILQVAYAVAAKEGYRSSSRYDYTTKDRVLDLLEPSTRERKEAEETLASLEELDLKTFKRDLDEALAKAGNDDWATNVRAVMKSPHVTRRNLGTLVSSVSAVLRLRRERREGEGFSPGFLGSEGEKVKDVDATVVNVVEREEYQPYTRQTVVYKTVVLRTKEGKKATWRTTAKTPEVGRSIRFAATVKDATHYRGVDTTRLLRTKWQEVPQE